MVTEFAMRKAEHEWYERNMFWAPVGIAFAILLTTVGAMKGDLRWLLLLAWPLFVVGTWGAVKHKKNLPKWAVVIATTILTGAALAVLNAWLRPANSYTEKANVPLQSALKESPSVGPPKQEAKDASPPQQRTIRLRPKPVAQGSLSTPSQPASSQSVGGVDCTANQGNCAGVNNGTQQTNYGVQEPPPEILDLKQAKIGPGAGISSMGALGDNPGIRLVFSMSGEFDDPQFLITCDRPCRAINGRATHGNSFVQSGFPNTYRVVNHPNITLISLIQPRVLIGDLVIIDVRSEDDGDISVVDVKPYVRPTRKTQ